MEIAERNSQQLAKEMEQRRGKRLPRWVRSLLACLFSFSTAIGQVQLYPIKQYISWVYIFSRMVQEDGKGFSFEGGERRKVEGYRRCEHFTASNALCLQHPNSLVEEE